MSTVRESENTPDNSGSSFLTVFSPEPACGVYTHPKKGVHVAMIPKYKFETKECMGSQYLKHVIRSKYLITNLSRSCLADKQEGNTLVTRFH